ncbi:TonB-dependent receptor [Marinoscillum sp. MHG1-6]|uniref:SusC/RagA family TonB-linked outer membrane protein n=1 Tax=Marinoscillum sp. MHG1-6 TaxID=2959627 RepID=UPI0021586623|nr:TonB-dependent receptor [Marinoscillum sp. MHG1-6]
MKTHYKTLMLSHFVKHKVKSILTLFMVLLTVAASAQSRTITGKVTDGESGESLPGVTVLIKGTTTGAITDFDGNYQLEADEDAVISFSFVGYEDQEIPVGSQSVINPVMRISISELEEIVVVGYGEQDKADVTGVIVAVDAKDFNKGAIVSPEALLSGKVAGVQIKQGTGEPGGGMSITIRGGSTFGALGGNNAPLFVVDGVLVQNANHSPGGFSGGRNPLNFLNPNDIENITVLKDASAAAIYGSRGSNGVVIITTKSGSALQKPKLVYDGYFSMAEMAGEYDMLTGDELRNLVQANDPSLLERMGNANTNWMDEVLRPAMGQNHYLSFTSGIDNGGVRLSLGYQNIEGIIKNSNTERISVSFKYDQSFYDDQIKVSANVNSALTKDRFNDGIIGGAQTYDPTQPVYDTTNTELGGFFEYPVMGQGPSNPVSSLLQSQDFGEYMRNLGNFKIEYKPKFLPGLSASANLGVDAYNGDRKRYLPTTLRSQARQDTLAGELRFENMSRFNPTFTGILGYEKEIESIKSKINVQVGHEVQDFNSDYYGYRAYGLTTDEFDFYSAPYAKEVEPISSNQENRLVSYFGRINYSFDDKYLLTLNLRRDGSSKFGPENQFGWFPSMALGWRLLDENFMDFATGIFSDLKVRVGYGVTGNQEIANYQYLASYSLSAQTAMVQMGDTYYNTLRPNGYNSFIKWEETTSTNIGVDFGVLQGRISGSVEVYRKSTSDLLASVSVPALSNLTNRLLSNSASLQNQGIELQVNTVVLDNRDWSWNVSFNASYNENKVTGYSKTEPDDFEGYPVGGIMGGVGNTIQMLRLGEATRSFYVYETIKGEDGNPVYGADEFGNPRDPMELYVDQNGDGQISSEDLIIYKKPDPSVIFGLTSFTSYKNFDLNFTLRANLGQHIYNNMASAYGYMDNVRGVGPNVVNLHKSVLQTGYVTEQYYSDAYIEDASFLRVDNVTLGYNINTLPNMKVRFYGTLQNPLLFTKYTGLDPEVFGGIDRNPYPKSRTAVLGLNVTF